MKIVILDSETLGRDMDLTPFQQFGEVIIYPLTSACDVPQRVFDADIIITNKVLMNEESLSGAQNLKLICVTATGINNLDLDYLASKNIAWKNVAGYSTESVAQHTFSMLFYLMSQTSYYDKYVKFERYVQSPTFTHLEMPFNEIKGKTWGIIGLGNIGRRVADIAQLFGANVIYFSPSGAPAQEGYTKVDFDTLLTVSDFITVHAPLNEHTTNLMDAQAFAKMKKSAYFINVGRGPIVVETDLANALNNDEIAGAGLDVLCIEPMVSDSPFLAMKDSSKLFITPHIAWASVEARTKLIELVVENISDFIKTI